MSIGPPFHVLGVNVGPAQPLPADGVIQVAFDRYLLPASVNRQSVGLIDGAREPLPASLVPMVFYDPVARTVTLAGPAEPWLTEGQPYTLVLGVPEGDADQGGLRAIDRATLAPDEAREIPFLVGPPAGAAPDPAVSLCRDVLPIFAAKCGAATCHGDASLAATGLVLATSSGIASTARGRIAHGTSAGARTADPPSAGRVFGVDMPIIDPGDPGNSWLMYKIDLARLPVAAEPAPGFACDVGAREPSASFAFAPLVASAQRAADDAERARLGALVLGREMPLPAAKPGGYRDAPLSFDEREKVRLWIKSLTPGAPLPECGACGPR